MCHYKEAFVQSTRNLSEQEFKILTKSLNRLDKNNSYANKVLSVWTLLALIGGVFFYFRMDSKSEIYMLVGAIFTYIGIGAWAYIETKLKYARERKKIDYVFQKNKVESIKVVSENFIELSEFKDEGVHYLFQIENNRILSFGGQDFYSSKKFPSNDFEIAICYDAKGRIVLLEKYVNGIKIQPRAKINGKEKWDLLSNPNYPKPEEFTIIDGKLEEYIKVLLTQDNGT
jgi:hypothetical protein